MALPKQKTDTLFLFARDLCGNDAHHWKLTYEQVPSNNAYLEVAELLDDVPGFVIHGTFETQNLISGTYQVALLIKIGQTSKNENENTVLNFHLNQTNGYVKDCNVDLQNNPRDEWIEITIDDSVKIIDKDRHGKVILKDKDPHGRVEFSITKVGNNKWDKKFLVHAVVIKLINDC